MMQVEGRIRKDLKRLELDENLVIGRMRWRCCNIQTQTSGLRVKGQEMMMTIHNLY